MTHIEAVRRHPSAALPRPTLGSVPESKRVDLHLRLGSYLALGWAVQMLSPTVFSWSADLHLTGGAWADEGEPRDESPLVDPH